MSSIQDVRSAAIFDVVQVLMRDHRVPYDVVQKVRAMINSPEPGETPLVRKIDGILSNQKEGKVYPSADELLG